jgi:exonuclease III
MDMRFSTWNVRSLYRAGSLMTVGKEISKYKLDLVGVQDVRWDKVGTIPAGKYTFFYRKRNENHELGIGFLYTKENHISSYEGRVCDRMSYIIPSGRWCDIIVLNVHALTEDKIDNMKDGFHKEIEHVFEKFPKYHVKIVRRFKC